MCLYCVAFFWFILAMVMAETVWLLQCGLGRYVINSNRREAPNLGTASCNSCNP